MSSTLTASSNQVGTTYVEVSMERSLGVRKGAWTGEEDKLLRKCVEQYGEGRWHQVPSRAGLTRCRKSCRLRWLNYLKPDIKRGEFSADEVDLMIRLHNLLGNRWSLIAGRLPGRTANDVKNYWNTNLRQKMVFSNKDVKSKPEPKSITKANIIKPRPWSFKNLSKRLRGNYGTPFINVGPQFPEDLCMPSTMALPPSDNESERVWWETLLEDKEINLTDKNSWLTYGLEVHQDPINSLFVEENAPAGGTKVGDIFCEQGQRCWSDTSFDADLWNPINTEQDQQPLERI